MSSKDIIELYFLDEQKDISIEEFINITFNLYKEQKKKINI